MSIPLLSILDTQTILFSIGLLALIWAFFLLTHRRGNLKANRYLSSLISVLAIFIIRRTAELEENSLALFLYFISHGLIFVIGPSIYFHIIHLIGKSVRFRGLHFLPALISVSGMGVLYFFREELKDVENHRILINVSIVLISIQVIHVLVYVFLSRSVVTDFSRRYESYYSSLSRINLGWMRYLIVVALILGTAIMGLHLLILSGGYYSINNTVDFLFLILLAAITLSVIYRSWRHPEVISGLYEEKGKYRNAKLSTVESQELKQRLNKLIETEKIFLIQELTIKQVADTLETPSHLLSQLLNDHYKTNFFNFINNLRVEYVLGKIDNGELGKMTLEAIAYESGFNSKSTFNRAFRRKMGCSPKEYQSKSAISMQ